MGDVTPENQGLWLSSYSALAEIVDLPMLQSGPGSAVSEVLAMYLPPYTKGIHNGSLSLFNLFLPLVPNPSHIGRVYSVGPDAVALKKGDLVFFNPWFRA